MQSRAVAEAHAQELSALQAQVEALAGDAFEGMCALGIESNRVAALVDALVSVGVDPNPILNSVENEHLVADAAGEVEDEPENGLGFFSVVHLDDAISSTPLPPTADKSVVSDGFLHSVVDTHDNPVNISVQQASSCSSSRQVADPHHVESQGEQ
jgi:hypothetical protein